MKIASLQMDIIKNNKDKNISNVDSLIGNNKLDLVVLPELFSTGYFFESKSQIEEISEKYRKEQQPINYWKLLARKKLPYSWNAC